MNKYGAKPSGLRARGKNVIFKTGQAKFWGKKDLVESMPRRFQDMIACGGLVTKY